MSDTTIDGSDASSRAHGCTTRTSRPPVNGNGALDSLFAMWMSDVHSIGGYTFAGGPVLHRARRLAGVLALVLGIGLVNFA